MIRVGLPWPAAVLNPNARAHRMMIARARKRARSEAHWDCRLQGVRRIDAERAVVRVTFCPPLQCGPAPDLDNAIASFKAAQDGVADAIGIDDGRWDVIYALGERVPGGRVIVTIAIAQTAE